MVSEQVAEIFVLWQDFFLVSTSALFEINSN